MIILIIDDDDYRHKMTDEYLGKDHTIYHAYTFDQAIKILSRIKSKIDLALFDHDLGDFIIENGKKIERKGSTIASHMVRFIDEQKWPERIIVHSWNDYGSKDIESIFKSVNVSVSRAFFGPKLLERLKTELKP